MLDHVWVTYPVAGSTLKGLSWGNSSGKGSDLTERFSYSAA